MNIFLKSSGIQIKLPRLWAGAYKHSLARQQILWTSQKALALLSMAIVLSTQGGVVFVGFEEHPLGTTPAYTSYTPWMPSPEAPKPHVVNSAPGIPGPFEGQNFLWGTYITRIESPDHLPILSYRLSMYVPASPDDRISASVQGQKVTQFNSWQTYSGTFSTPVSSIGLNAISNQGEFFPSSYGIDSIEFITVPEPRTISLLALGLGAIVFRPRPSHKARSAI